MGDRPATVGGDCPVRNDVRTVLAIPRPLGGTAITPVISTIAQDRPDAIAARLGRVFRCVSTETGKQPSARAGTTTADGVRRAMGRLPLAGRHDHPDVHHPHHDRQCRRCHAA